MQDELIRIPRTEYPQRWEKVQVVMRERKLDIILAYSDDRATYGNAYARYYTDFQTHFEPVLVMFVPDREPLILTGPETDGYAGERAAVREIKVLAELAAEDEDYPFSKVETLKEIIRPVSYTHLDVYKRQGFRRWISIAFLLSDSSLSASWARISSWLFRFL